MPMSAMIGKSYRVSAYSSPSRSDAAGPRHHSIEHEQHDRAYDGHREADRVTLAIPSDGAAEKSAEQGARDAQQHGHYKAARVASGRQKLCHDTDDQTEDDPSKDCHASLLRTCSAKAGARSVPDGLSGARGKE